MFLMFKKLLLSDRETEGRRTDKVLKLKLSDMQWRASNNYNNNNNNNNYYYYYYYYYF